MPLETASSLDSLSSLTQYDPKGMYDLTVGFYDQCRTAVQIGSSATLPGLKNLIHRVHLTGLGGSAAGGDFIKAVFDGEGACSFTVNRDYHLPHFIGPNDLVFCASYSGSTEETLSAYAEAKSRSAQIIAITSGGRLKELADQDGYAVISVPGGQPPRTAMGYMMVPVLIACERLGLVPKQDWDGVLAGLSHHGINQWGVEVPTAQNLAKQLALSLHGKLPILYGVGPAAAIVANRWKCQIHENAKLLAFANGYPELNHNEILGWIGASTQADRFTGLRLSLGEDSAKMAARAEVTEGLIKEVCPFTSVVPSVNSESRLLTRMLNLTFLGDFVSIYLARLVQADPEVIPSIDYLKAALAKVP